MKIGILTFHYSNHNFGAVLQTMSMKRLFESFGYETYIINYQHEEGSIKKTFVRRIKNIFGYQFSIFRKKYIKNILYKTYSEIELSNLNKIIDVFIVGSDQVWRYQNDASIFRYFFDFVDEHKLRIAYAASFGTSEWNATPEVTVKVKDLLSRFNAVSVREKTGRDICSKFNVASTITLDPTLVVDRDIFDDLTLNKSKLHTDKEYLAFMVLDETKEIISKCKIFSQNRSLKFVNIKGWRIGYKDLYLYNNVNKWLTYIKHSGLIVTDSFHCTVFSILFRRNFICLVNHKRGLTRLMNLLTMLGLENRLCYNINDINNVVYNNDINFDAIEKQLDFEKAKSIDFIRNSLSI